MGTPHEANLKQLADNRSRLDARGAVRGGAGIAGRDWSCAASAATVCRSPMATHSGGRGIPASAPEHRIRGALENARAWPVQALDELVGKQVWLCWSPPNWN